MVGKGWVYTAIDRAALPLTAEPNDLASLVAYRLKYGYAIAIPRGQTEFIHDPNDELVNNLTADGRRQYFLDLDGESEAEGEVAVPSEAPNGCRPQAIHEAHRGIPLFDPKFSSLPIEAISRILSDPGYQEADLAWSRCMKSKGFDFKSSANVPTELSEEFHFNNRRTSSGGDFPSYELAVAGADIDCYEETIHPVRVQIENTILQEFVESGRLPSAALQYADE